jgi:hypothetical protein
LVAAQGAAVLITFDPGQATNRLAVRGGGIRLHPGHHRAGRKPRPLHIDLCRGHEGGQSQRLGISVRSSKRKCEFPDLLVECGIRDRRHAQGMQAGIARGARLAFRRFRSLALAAVPAAGFALKRAPCFDWRFAGDEIV